jgi:ATP-dependent DNA helicase RecG
MEQLVLSFEKPLPLLSPDDIYQSASQTLLTVLNEDRRIERKPANTHGRVLGEYHSMWANTSPEGGVTVLGMENDGSFSGCTGLSQNELNDREKASHIYCPEAHVDSKRVPVINEQGREDFVLVFRTYYREDRLVCDVSGDAFSRVADQKHKLTPDEMHELKIDKGQVDLELEPTALKFPDDFRIDLIGQFVEGVKRVRKLDQPHSDREILEHRRLGKIEHGEFVPNVACALLFAKDPNKLFPGCSVRFLRYEGETEETGGRYNVVKDVWVEGSILELIVESTNVLQSQLREFSRLGEDGKFYTAPEYPFEAWYETIVNACVHRSYGLRNMNIFVKMFDDRLVIESPGGFPPLVTPDNIYNSHHPRNPHLMRALFYLDLVKCHNEGTRRMRDAMQLMKLPVPQFEQKEVATGYMAVRVTLKNDRKQRKEWVDSDVSRFVSPELAKLLTQDETRVLNFVSEHGAINVSECQRLLPHIRTWHSVKKLLMRLHERGVLMYEHREDIERDPDACFKLQPVAKVNGGRGK